MTDTLKPLDIAMQTAPFRQFMIHLLEVGSLPASKVPRGIRNSHDFQNWLYAGFVCEKHAVNGGKLYCVIDSKALQEIFKQKFPSTDTNVPNDTVSNVHSFRDSKARARKGQGVCLLRGRLHIWVNGQPVNLQQHTNQFGIFAGIIRQLEVPKLCIVENLDVFLRAEEVLGDDTVFLHTYGRVGREQFRSFECPEIWMFSDYDFVGLDEYLRVKATLPQTQFFIPENFDDLSAQFSKNLQKRNGGTQLLTTRVLESVDPTVVRIREQVRRTGKFLEQQALFSRP